MTERGHVSTTLPEQHSNGRAYPRLAQPLILDAGPSTSSDSSGSMRANKIGLRKSTMRARWTRRTPLAANATPELLPGPKPRYYSTPFRSAPACHLRCACTAGLAVQDPLFSRPMLACRSAAKRAPVEAAPAEHASQTYPPQDLVQVLFCSCCEERTARALLTRLKDREHLACGGFYFRFLFCLGGPGLPQLKKNKDY